MIFTIACPGPFISLYKQMYFGNADMPHSSQISFLLFLKNQKNHSDLCSSFLVQQWPSGWVAEFQVLMDDKTSVAKMLKTFPSSPFVGFFHL